MLFSSSPYHTDEYYAKQVDELSVSPDIDTILLYDMAGVLEKAELARIEEGVRRLGELLADEEERRRLAAAGRRFVEAEFDQRFGYPTTITIGTLANDAGTRYEIANVRLARGIRPVAS